MAVERYTVCHYFADKHMRIRTKYCTICGIWLYAAAMTVPPLLGWGRYGPDLYKSSCSFDYFSNDVNRQSFMIYLLFFGFFVPGWIIIACYAGIFKQIVRNEQTMQLLLLRPRKSSKRRLDAPHSSVIQKSRSSDPMLINESDVHYQLRPVVSLTEMGKFDPVKTHKYVRSFPSDHWDFVCRLMARREVQFARLTILIVSAFFLCWTPYTIVTIFCQLGVKSFFSPTASVITVVFAKSSVALNPLIYALKEKRFRSSVKRLVNRLLRRRCK